MHTPQILELNVQEPYFSLIKSGQKTVEGRLGKDKYFTFKQGDKVIFNNNLEVEIKAIVRYKTFREMLIFEGLKNVLPGVLTLEEAVKVYYQFYSPQDEQKYGVAAICLVNLK